MFQAKLAKYRKVFTKRGNGLRQGTDGFTQRLDPTDRRTLLSEIVQAFSRTIPYGRGNPVFGPWYDCWANRIDRFFNR